MTPPIVDNFHHGMWGRNVREISKKSGLATFETALEELECSQVLHKQCSLGSGALTLLLKGKAASNANTIFP